MEQQDRESMNIEGMIQKAINAEAKVGLRSSNIIWDLDARYPWGHRLSHNTSSKMQTQGTSAKEPRTKESRPKEIKSTNGKTFALPCFDEPAKSNCKKKK